MNVAVYRRPPLTTLSPPDVLRSRLDPGEHLIWWDRPRQGFLLRKADVFLVPFSLFWGGFAVFWEYSVATGGAPAHFKLWGIPFVAIGIYLIAGRFFHDIWRRSRLFYGLTGSRALIATPGSCRSIALDRLGEIHLQEGAGGEGSIAFGREPLQARVGVNGTASWTGAPAIPTFERIPDARGVHAAIREAQKKAALAAERSA